MSVVIGVFGGIGALFRFFLSELFYKIFSNRLRYLSIVIINLIGCFMLGLTLQLPLSDSVIKVISIGFLGAFTTFSTFSYETIELYREKKWFMLIAYLLLTIIGGILFYKLGQNSYIL